jgi:hypothetical protein
MMRKKKRLAKQKEGYDWVQGESSKLQKLNNTKVGRTAQGDRDEEELNRRKGQNFEGNRESDL